MSFDEPDADWADEYAWTRYRGPQPYPVPEDWVLQMVEGDGVMWQRHPEHGQDAAHDSDLPDEAWPLDPEDHASLGHEWPAGADIMQEDPYHELTINGEIALVVVDGADSDDWWRAIAETLARYARGEDYETVLLDLGLERLRARPFDSDGEGGDAPEDTDAAEDTATLEEFEG